LNYVDYLQIIKIRCWYYVMLLGIENSIYFI